MIKLNDNNNLSLTVKIQLGKFFSAIFFLIHILIIQAFAGGSGIFVALMPVNAYFGNEKLSISPAIDLRVPIRKTIYGGGFDYSLYNMNSKMVKDASSYSLPHGWNYYGEISHILKQSTKKVSIPIYNYYYYNPQNVTRTSTEYMGDGVTKITKVTGTEYDVKAEDTGERTYERHTRTSALRLGVCGGQKVRDFGDIVNEQNSALPLLKLNMDPTSISSSAGGLYGTVKQHSAFAGYEFFSLIAPDGWKNPACITLSLDILVQFHEEMGEYVFDGFSDPYLITDKTYEALDPKPVGFQFKFDFRVGHLLTKFGFGLDPGTGGFRTQIAMGVAFF